MRKFSSTLSLEIDRAVIGTETTTGLQRLRWRILLAWLTRGIGR